jgi:hypothetical protein
MVDARTVFIVEDVTSFSLPILASLSRQSHAVRNDIVTQDQQMKYLVVSRDV